MVANSGTVLQQVITPKLNLLYLTHFHKRPIHTCFNHTHTTKELYRLYQGTQRHIRALDTQKSHPTIQRLTKTAITIQHSPPNSIQATHSHSNSIMATRHTGSDTTSTITRDY